MICDRVLMMDLSRALRMRMMEGSYRQCKHFRGRPQSRAALVGGVFLTLSLPLALWRDDPASALCCEYPALAYNLCLTWLLSRTRRGWSLRVVEQQV